MNSSIPNVKGLPLVGGALKMRTHPLHVLDEAKCLGDVVSLGGIGSRHYYLVNHPDYIRTLLAKQDAQLNRNGVVKQMFGRSMFVMNGQTWLERRRLLQPTYHVTQNSCYFGIIMNVIAETSARWQQYAKNGTPIRLMTQMLDLARNIISSIMFATHIDGSPEYLRDIFTQSMEWNRWRLLKTPLDWPTLRNRSFQQAQKHLDRIVSDIIRDYHKNNASTSFLDALLRAKSDGILTDQDVRGEILNILAVGHLTTGAVLTWTLYEMIKHPAIAEVVRAEYQHILGDQVLHLEDIQKLTYTSQVLQETLRLYPPVWGFTRKITNTLVLGDKALPQGSRVLISPYSMHRHPTYWAQPEVFDPQRFQGEQPGQRHSSSYFPYGYGKRQCPGKELATLITMMVIPALLQQFRLVAISTEPIKLLARSTLVPCQEILITVECADAYMPPFPNQSTLEEG